MSVKTLHGDNWTLQEMLGCVGDGWSKIVIRLYRLCDRRNITVVQVKEKFGGLRFYVGDCESDIEDAIDAAEAESYRTCEVCGKIGSARPLSWVKTLCEEHYMEACKDDKPTT